MWRNIICTKGNAERSLKERVETHFSNILYPQQHVGFNAKYILSLVLTVTE